MDMDLKRQLRDKLDAIAPEYGMIELTYPSFVRCYGYHMQPLSAADAVDALNSLLDAATGVTIEIEADGARNGGEWFGGGRVWRAAGRWGVPETKEMASSHIRGQEEEQAAGERDEEVRGSWIVRNFWNAFDALEE
jgi:cell division control protein 45